MRPNAQVERPAATDARPKQQLAGEFRSNVGLGHARLLWLIVIAWETGFATRTRTLSVAPSARVNVTARSAMCSPKVGDIRDLTTTMTGRVDRGHTYAALSPAVTHLRRAAALKIVSPSKRLFAPCLNRRGAFFKDSSQLVAKSGAVIVPVHGHSMLHGSLQKLFFTVGRYRDRAIHFAWKLTAVYVFACHYDLLGAFSMSAVVFCVRRRVAPKSTLAPRACLSVRTRQLLERTRCSPQAPSGRQR